MTITIFFYIFFLIITLFNIKIISLSKKREKIFTLLISFFLAGVAFYSIPLEGWDLSRHFVWTDEIRNSELTVLEYLFNNTNKIGLYGKEFFLYNFIRYIIAKFFSNNHWLPCICTFINYVIIMYIYVDWHYNNYTFRKHTILSPLFCSVLFPFVQIVTGIRNGLAAAIAGLAVYLYLYKKKGSVLFAFLILLATTVHPVILLAVPFALLSKLGLGIKGHIFVLFFSLSLKYIAQFAINSQYDFIAMNAQNFLYSSYTGSRWTAIMVIIIILTYEVFHLNLKRFVVVQNSNKKENELFEFLSYYMTFIICNINVYDLVVRPAYLLGVLSPVISSRVDYSCIFKFYKQKKIIYIINIILIVLSSIELFRTFRTMQILL